MLGTLGSMQDAESAAFVGRPNLPVRTINHVAIEQGFVTSEIFVDDSYLGRIDMVNIYHRNAWLTTISGTYKTN
jgi:hypothetical protein